MPFHSITHWVIRCLGSNEAPCRYGVLPLDRTMPRTPTPMQILTGLGSVENLNLWIPGLHVAPTSFLHMDSFCVEESGDMLTDDTVPQAGTQGPHLPHLLELHRWATSGCGAGQGTAAAPLAPAMLIVHWSRKVSSAPASEEATYVVSQAHRRYQAVVAPVTCGEHPGTRTEQCTAVDVSR